MYVRSVISCSFMDLQKRLQTRTSIVNGSNIKHQRYSALLFFSTATCHFLQAQLISPLPSTPSPPTCRTFLPPLASPLPPTPSTDRYLYQRLSPPVSSRIQSTSTDGGYNSDEEIGYTSCPKVSFWLFFVHLILIGPWPWYKNKKARENTFVPGLTMSKWMELCGKEEV